MASIQFIGAARTVTGSKHLLKIGDHRVLIDCGLYQGLKELRLRNWEPLPLAEKALSCVVVTHAHVDHVGFLPRIVKRGFTGTIYATPPTCDLMRIMLRDSARLQEEEAHYANERGYSKHSPALPLYTVEDAERTLGLIRAVAPGEEISPIQGLTLSFLEAGHILGSAMVLAKLREGPGESAVLFSGDLGRRGTPMLNDPAAVSDADWLVLESTYGDRLHTETDRKEALGRIVRQALGKGGVLLIPAFAVERTQEILYILNVLGEARDIPSVPIYIDSPMAVDVTKIFSRYEQTFDDEARRIISTGEKVLDVENLHYCSTVEESKSLNKRQGPMIIISASGMAVGGRVLHHLKHRLPDRRNTVLLVGYQAVATRGRSLQEGAKKIRIHGEEVPVRASIVSLDGFSSHADYNEILHWLANFRNAPRTLLVHGEDSAQAALKARIEEKYGWEVAIPAYLDEVPL